MLGTTSGQKSNVRNGSKADMEEGSRHLAETLFLMSGLAVTGVNLRDVGPVRWRGRPSGLGRVRG